MFNKISKKGFVSYNLDEPDCWLEVDSRAIFSGAVYLNELVISASDGKTITLKTPTYLANSVIYNLPSTLPTNSAYLQTDISGNLSWNSDINITGLNIGSGFPVFFAKTGNFLQFRTLVSGPGISISSSYNELYISNSFSASNLGNGHVIFAGNFSDLLKFKSLVAGPNIILSSSTDEIFISGANPGEINTASNIGTGHGIFQQKVGTELQFKSLNAPTSSFGNISIVTSSNDISFVSRPQSETIRIFEDWITNATTGHFNWGATNSGTGAASSIVATGVDSTTIKAIGVVQLSTGTTATGRAALHQYLNAWRLENLKNSVMEWRIAIPTLSTDIEDFTVCFGWISSATTTNQVNGLYFFYNRLNFGDFWTTVSANGGSRTITVTTIPVIANEWKRFRIETNLGLTQTKFYIDDVLIKEENTNLPIGAGKLVGPGLIILKNTGTAARTFLCDYMELTAHHIGGR
jgi:hypothetical protein